VSVVRWTASYVGSGHRTAFHAPSWEDAANWLRVMIEAAYPEDIYDHCVRRLRDAPQDEPFHTGNRLHAFTIAAGTPPDETQGRLFG